MVRYGIRWFAWFFWLAILGLKALWILVYFDFFPQHSRLIALGFFPPLWFILLLFFPLLLFLLSGARKMALWVGGVYLAFVLGFGDFSLQKADALSVQTINQAPKLSVVALNVRYYSYGLDMFIDAIRDMDADLYLLSENVLNGSERQKLESALQPGLSFLMGRQEETAIISRYPVIDFREVELPSRQASLFENNEVALQERNPHRSFLHARVQVDGHPVHVISIRFLAGRAKDRTPAEVLTWGFYVLKSQLEELAFFLNYLEKLEGPIVFGGDLNATPSSIVIRRLSAVATDVYLNDHFWGGFTFSTGFPSVARLDYLFCRNGIGPLRSERLSHIISDHYPVFAEFAITGMKSNFPIAAQR